MMANEDKADIFIAFRTYDGARDDTTGRWTQGTCLGDAVYDKEEKNFLCRADASDD